MIGLDCLFRGLFNPWTNKYPIKLNVNHIHDVKVYFGFCSILQAFPVQSTP